MLFVIDTIHKREHQESKLLSIKCDNLSRDRTNACSSYQAKSDLQCEVDSAAEMATLAQELAKLKLCMASFMNLSQQTYKTKISDSYIYYGYI